MKKQYNGKKMRYGSSAAILTATVIVVAVLLNVIVTALSSICPWMFLDMTVEGLYTVSEDCFTLLRTEAIAKVDEARTFNKEYNANGGLNIPSFEDEVEDLLPDAGTEEDGDTEFVPRDENISINIYFMDDRDVLVENQTMNYIVRTAEDLQQEFKDHITITHIDLYKNPSAVEKFRKDGSTVNDTDVIVEFGTEYRVLSASRFYVIDSSTEAVLGYDGEKQFASAILAVTRSQSPICLVDMAHGESFSDMALLYTLEEAGYEIAFTEEYLTDEVIADVETQFGGDVRLILIYNPTSDFIVSTASSGETVSDIDELDTLDRFLDGKSSMMVFLSPTSPVLANFEEYLEEWGISFDRAKSQSGTSSYMIKEDDSHSLLNSDGGYTNVAEYVSTGLGGQITSSLRSVAYPKKIIFRNAMSISYHESYTETTYDPTDSDTSESTETYVYGTYYSNGVGRDIYDLFVSSGSAVAMANGEIAAKATEFDPFRYMTVSCERRVTQQDDQGISSIEENSYVIACGSTEFATEKYLQSGSFGNSDFMLSTLSVISREPVPVGIVYKAFGDYEIDTITTATATVWTVCLAAIPAVAAFATGVVILVKRKYA